MQLPYFCPALNKSFIFKVADPNLRLNFLQQWNIFFWKVCSQMKQILLTMDSETAIIRTSAILHKDKSTIFTPKIYQWTLATDNYLFEYTLHIIRQILPGTEWNLLNNFVTQIYIKYYNLQYIFNLIFVLRTSKYFGLNLKSV